MNSLTAVSLFCSGGIGDLALQKAGVDVIVANELITERASVFSYNFPNTSMVAGDIWEVKNSIIDQAKKILGGSELDFILATPPCQGMSKNGRGKILNVIRSGDRSVFDPRNELIKPTIDIILALMPKVVVFENVPEMENTIIPDDTSPAGIISILDYISQRLGPTYRCEWKVIEFADYGVPQKRQRLITICTRIDKLKEIMSYRGCIFPSPTHSIDGSLGLLRWITVRDAIQELPPIDAKDKKSAIHPELPYHEVPTLDEDKYFWVKNTPEEKSAFDNQCITCPNKFNTNHGTGRVNGINKANISTPLYCDSCGSILPRPWVGKGDDRRIMKGFTSAYKRMSWDTPASTLTTNFAYACSDNKIHPDQNRTLSILEAMILHTLTEFTYQWKMKDGKLAKKQLIRDIIGESVPPRGLHLIFQHLIDMQNNASLLRTQNERPPQAQLNLFDA